MEGGLGDLRRNLREGR